MVTIGTVMIRTVVTITNGMTVITMSTSKNKKTIDREVLQYK